ncbi:Lrp/AsnC family transcriptional regulator [Candidatus Woesearchaeota archaeon]|nr:Lrp/AsnC family transcriptional regulator [Candidatus Woesearchaeota archaeon]
MVFALLGVHQNKIDYVLNKIRGIGQKYVNKVHLVYGEYDIIAEIKAHNPETSTSILKALRETDGVNTLKTYVVSDQLTDENLKEILPPEQNW